MVLDI